jgi:hypothetical protein
MITAPTTAVTIVRPIKIQPMMTPICAISSISRGRDSPKPLTIDCRHQAQDRVTRLSGNPGPPTSPDADIVIVSKGVCFTGRPCRTDGTCREQARLRGYQARLFGVPGDRGRAGARGGNSRACRRYGSWAEPQPATMEPKAVASYLFPLRTLHHSIHPASDATEGLRRRRRFWRVPRASSTAAARPDGGPDDRRYAPARQPARRGDQRH